LSWPGLRRRNFELFELARGAFGGVRIDQLGRATEIFPDAVREKRGLRFNKKARGKLLL